MALSASELRIGNWIDTKDFHFDKFKGLYQYDPEWYKYVHMFEPIPLSEEWLLRFGFERVKSAEYDFELEIQKNDNFGSSDYSIYVDSGTDNCTNKFTTQIVSESGDWLNTTVKYVHQLQNLYWCLCGEELQIIQ